MALKIHILSNEYVKPSSPTKDDLKNYELSLLDQLSPNFFLPIIFYYNREDLAGGDRDDILSSRLKESLSNALTMFYPMAGRLKKGDSTVNCNDAGVRYLEAKVDSNIIDLIEDFRDAKLLDGLIPFTSNDGSQGEELLGIQINYFNCGGVAIGANISHKIVDAFSYITFMSSWAKLSCEGNTTVRPSFVASSIFPPKENLGDIHEASSEIIVTRRFVFDARLIAHVREQARTKDVREPSRVEAVSSFIWKHSAGDKPVKQYIASHAVNLRARMVPPMPEYAMGNLIGITFADLDYEESDKLAIMARKIREAIRGVDGEFIREIREGEWFAEMAKNMGKMGEQLAKKEAQLFNFSSWCRFPFYDVDFGIGKPVWVSLASIDKGNSAVLVDSKCGQGVEAWWSEFMGPLKNIHILSNEFITSLPISSSPWFPVYEVDFGMGKPD
ncbi:stemmadenine O-acetyltransferase-like [Impatiens glandulifera]|uniref:stemmadenine O-acetyltransferase-like n=1 Tax=Impatiens glandulifera TaxID=253017 RepID=UPI001FB149AF|nr:stemmadenine O-acetyltransferase-like [Impatiens glandulifera]